jgi:hypothetical protein
LALVPFFNMLEKKVDSGGGVTFDLDGGIYIRVGSNQEEGEVVATSPGNFTDTEYFMRYLSGDSCPTLIGTQHKHAQLKLLLSLSLVLNSP